MPATEPWVWTLKVRKRRSFAVMELTFREVDAPDGVTVIEDGPRWQIANESGGTMTVRSVARVYDLTHTGRLRMFAHGYQSWTWSGLAVVGEIPKK